MRKIIKSTSTFEKKPVSKKDCITCKNRFGVHALNDYHWRGFCGKSCFDGYVDPNRKNVKLVIVEKEKKSKNCLFCRNRITGLNSKKIFCNDFCKANYNKNKS